ncbi:S9 family peptidase [Urbifossiella limnaea]|uniref:Prolyl tripeptidyl peptidase n=1 Tax=Urbifossiella limnaea TaxID=2528023 RepID=A0A517XTL3_9BACT|nr:S9 family peptidase [Urbifossiella limnaea]QDU20837.1 Prolyl tripeptidyl peptidase precursor [Urbifossiella limnaea]
MRRTAFLVLLFVVPPAAAQPRPVTPADYAGVATANEVAVSPDGTQVAYTVATWDETADNRRTDLWVTTTDGKGTPRRLTSGRANDRHPKWAADGSAVYVVRNVKEKDAKVPPRDGSSQVWRVGVNDKAASAALTTVKGGVTGYDLAAAAGYVFYTADDEVTDPDDFLKLRERYPRIEYGHGKRKVSVLYRVPTSEGDVLTIHAGKRYIREFAVTTDGKRVAMITAPDDTVIRWEGDSRVDVWEAGKVTVTDQAWKKSASSPWPWLEGLAWNPSGNRLAYGTIFDAYPAEVVVCDHDGGNWAAGKVKRDGWQVRGYGSPLAWRSDAVLGLLTDDQARVGFAEYDTTKQTTDRQPLDGVTYGFAYVPGGSGRRVAILGTPQSLGELWYFGGPGARTGISDLNPQAKDWRLPSVERVTWTAPDGTKVGGALELPPDYKKGSRKLPLVVAIHGGPTTSSTAALQFDPHNGRLYFAAAGYAVLAPNYRGSTGYGDKFTTNLIGRENDLDVKDILAGIRHLIDAGIADPDRVAVMGWSNGGYLTNCLISLADSPVRVRAASSGAGILDTVAEWGFNDEPAYPRVFKKGLPWEQPDLYRRTSPTYQLGNVKTPTLIHVGEKDDRCPPGHSRMLYRALRENLSVPTQLCVYPGEPHGLGKLSHRRAKMEWDLAWFNRYLRADR